MASRTHILLSLALLAPVWLGCEVRGVIGSNKSMDGAQAKPDDDGADERDDGLGEGGAASVEGGANGDDDTTDGGAARDDAIFDVHAPDSSLGCAAPLPVVCDADDDDPFHAVGLGCAGGFDATVTHAGDARSIAVHEGQLGSSGIYAPRQGERMLIMSTGDAKDMIRTPAELKGEHEECDPETCPNQWLTTDRSWPMGTLQPPINLHAVDPVDGVRDCNDDPTLVGMGDCSNTLAGEFGAGDEAYDWSALTIVAEVPKGADALAFEFAFFSAEYPLFAGAHEFNDLAIAWLESELWTGNIAFDGGGDSISMNSVFLDYRDADTEDCPNCKAPELAGFGAEHHAGTDWLRTVAPVAPGETIQLIIAITDVSDGIFDSAILLDGFEWTCSNAPPLTKPVG